jgi:hypothetical protein
VVLRVTQDATWLTRRVNTEEKRESATARRSLCAAASRSTVLRYLIGVHADRQVTRVTIPDLAFTPMEFAVQSRLRYRGVGANASTLERISFTPRPPVIDSKPAQQ